jgi:hypothetical protein
MSHQNLRLDFESGAERDWQVRFGVEGSLLEQLASEGLGLLRGSVSLVKLVGGQCFARRPRESFEICRIDTMLNPVGLQRRISGSKIPLRECSANVHNNIGETQG